MPRTLVEFPGVTSGGAEPARQPDGLLHYGDLTPCLTELLDLRVHRYAQRDAVVEVGAAGRPTQRISYRELWTSASRVAGGLGNRGIGYGDRVGIALPNGIRWAQAFLGALLSGAVPVPINCAAGPAEVAHMLADSAIDFLLDGELPIGPAFIDDGASLGEVALLCYTRGLGAKPKGVELSNENLLSAIESVIAAERLPTDGVKNLVLLPLAHATGCVDQFLPTLAVGGTVFVGSGIEAGDVRAIVEDEEIDVLTAGPATYGLLAAGRVLSGLVHDGMRRICCAGGALTDQVSAALRSAFPAAAQWSWWGATETSGVALTMPEDAASTHPGCVGAAFGATEVALWGPEADAGVGELLCRGPNVMRGYWRDPVATAAQFTGQWFHTGDQVRIDSDGFVRLLAQ
ncbi:long-chain fatty acid--CoA ligase [Skermania sp. ID1734]|uniref:class I adenylate-forming enzyme family protein n=1 Tax=Skermania sp. ID1734 TaxID=2597516 RepID=UPI00117D660F|nr:class I adenylate-forming enzyme family protein [Skermania sp. ID1734]TSE01872.1 long-chain fatty acid--CoA ligase [Skermania sp. ID1734]